MPQILAGEDDRKEAKKKFSFFPASKSRLSLLKRLLAQVENTVLEDMEEV